MRQIQFFLKTLSDLPACIDAFWRECPPGPHHVLVSVFSGWTNGANLHRLLKDIKQELPGAIIVGLTTGGEIFNGTISDRTTVLSFMVFDSTKINLRVYDLNEVTADEAADDLIDSTERLGVPAGIELITTPPTPELYKFLHRLSVLPPSVRVFGGVAGETEGAGQYIFTSDNIFDKAIIAINFIGDNLRVRVHQALGWQPLGKSFQITKLNDIDVIASLNYQPAINLYEKYLKITPAIFKYERVLFPLLFERNGSIIARMPKEAYSDGSLSLYANCLKGDHVRLAYGDPTAIQQNVQDTLSQIASFEPESIMIFNCISRRLFLESDEQIDVQNFPLIAPTSGAYVHGEIMRAGNEVIMQNMSLIAMSFREGPGTGKKPVELPKPKNFGRAMTIVQRLANFVKATTDELEAANHQLAHLAKIDRLTGIFNRGEIESILQKELSGKRKDEEPLSSIMIDLDNFKGINDTYGHGVGDKVLQTVSHIFARNIRRRDAAGRWGGEEFLIILPGASIDAAAAIAERIREQIASEQMLPDGKRVTASFGVAEFPRTGSYKEFYMRLDAALYDAKAKGKNCVVKSEG
ncbi:MAG: diguanylate cyclase [Selenomonadaceae bacterium]